MAFDPRRDLAVSVYEQTWREFYEWEQHNAREMLDRLDPDVDSESSLSDGLYTPYQPTQPPKPDDGDMTQHQPAIEVAHLQTFDGDIGIALLSSSPVLRCATVRAGPRYESCDAIIAPIFLGREDCIRWPRAIPFADDPSFDTDEYLYGLAGADVVGVSARDRPRLFRRLQARKMLCPEDPNIDAIEIATLRRLYSENFTLSEIEQMAILSRNPQDLLEICWQRDLPPWHEFTQYGDHFSTIAYRISDPESQLLREHYSRLMDQTCFHLLCIEPQCISHSHRQRLPMRDRPVPRTVTDGGQERAGPPCGDNCSISSPVVDEDVLWAEDELDTLALMVTQCPEISICQLAIVMDKPCREVLVQRRGLPQRNPEVFRPRESRQEVPREEAFDFPTNGKQVHLAFGCSHSGPCTLESQCPCAQNSLYCRKSCSCTSACGRQYPGCSCHASSKSAVCRTPQSCLCVRLSRECEPGLCKGCRTHEGRKKCCNRILGAAPIIRYKVAESAYGYGLYAREKIHSKQCIGEYIAEVIAPPRTDSQGVIARHVHRNYLFDWCEDDGLFLDSLEAGNATRFINHADGRKANATAIYKWVNGDIKLGIYALRVIHKNQEILINYGGNYFLPEPEEDDEDDEQRELSPEL